MMESGGERRAMEDEVETRRWMPTEWVMCSTCSGLVFRKQRTAIPKPDEGVLEVVTEAEKMRDLMRAVLLLGPLQDVEPAEATKKQRKILQWRRRIMMKEERCPTCYSSLLKAFPTFPSLLQKPGPDEDKAMVADLGSKAGSTEKSFKKEGVELTTVLRGKERKKNATEDEAMVADFRSEQKPKRSREEGKRSNSGLKEKKARSEDKEGSGSKKAKRPGVMEGSGSKEVKMDDNGSSKEEAKIKDITELFGGDSKTKMEIRRLLKKSLELLNRPHVKTQSKDEAKIEDSESALGNRKTKMVTKRLYKESIDILKSQHPAVPPTYTAKHYVNKRILDTLTARYEVDCVFHEYLECQYLIRRYAEYQVEVTDDEDDGHKLV